MSSFLRNGGQLLVEQLLAFGTERVFMVPGESFLPCIDALHDLQDRIASVVCRQEGGAAYMAEAHGKLTGQPGICFVSRGPGATNASIGVHTAQQDSTPMILFIGQVGGDTADRECFQEVDYRRMYAPLTKWVAQIERADRIPEYLARAWTIATSGRPGPVVLALPEDMLAQRVDVPLAARPAPPLAQPAAADMARMQAALESARTPLLLLGGSGWDDEARRNIQAFAERFALPVATAWRRLELFDNRHPQFVGQVSPSMAAPARELLHDSDLVLAVGTRLCEPTTLGYRWLQSPMPSRRLIHVHPDASEVGKLCVPELGMIATHAGFARAAQALRPSSAFRPARAANGPGAPARPRPMAGPLDLNEVGRTVARVLDAPAARHACVTAGAGNYALYAHRHIAFDGLGSQLSPATGAMGYGLPAAIAAKLHAPGRPVVCFAGDGCFQMTMQEMGTAAQYGLGIVVLLFNNRSFGTIRLHQERAYPNRAMATDLVNPDFAALARAYGGFGRVVTETQAFAAAFDEALAFAAQHARPALLELRYDTEQILPDMTLADVHAAAARAAA